jgi:hypothetical protein
MNNLIHIKNYNLCGSVADLVPFVRGTDPDPAHDPDPSIIKQN